MRYKYGDSPWPEDGLEPRSYSEERPHFNTRPTTRKEIILTAIMMAVVMILFLLGLTFVAVVIFYAMAIQSYGNSK